MQISIICAAKKNEKTFAPIAEEYFERVKGYGIKLNLHVIDFKNITSNSTHNKLRENQLILNALQADMYVICLDEKGKELDSKQFALKLRSIMDTQKKVCFVIGGAYGLSDEVKQRAAFSLALSKLTLPHQLARVVFAEQLYRAFTILQNEAYHH